MTKKIFIINIFISIILLITGCTSDDNLISRDSSEQTPTEEEVVVSEEPPIEYLIVEFEERLIQEVEEDYKVKKFDSKQELVNHLSEITTKRLANQYVQEFYREEEGKLYIIPRDGPMWIDTSIPYRSQKISEDKYLVVQENENMLWGNYQVEVTLKQTTSQWIISDIDTQVD